MANDPAATHEEWAIDHVAYSENNARTHDDEQIGHLVMSVERYGQTRPVLVDESGVLIAGHGTVMALERLGAESVWVTVARDWSESAKRAYRLADNRLADRAGWDRDTLANELAALVEDGVDYQALGFDDPEVQAMLAEPDFSAGSEDEQSRIDERAPKWVACPDCGKEFDASEQL